MFEIKVPGATLIVGAGGHLMSSAAYAVASAGSLIVCADSNYNNAQSTVNRIIESGFNAIAAEIDITKSQEIENLNNFLISQNIIIENLINGAGINAPTPFMEIERQEWLRILDVQLIGVSETCKVFAKGMLERGKGSIINISSASANPPLSKAFVYSAAKSAILNLTKNLAREWATSGVRVNAIRPGFFPTEWNRANFIDREREEAILGHTPMKRFGDPSELNSAFVWLLSDSASFVTGSEIAIDGGFSAMSI